MNEMTVTMESRVQGYAGLKRVVSESLLAGQRKIEALKVQTYWQTGKLISDYLKESPGSSTHGQAVVDRLALDLDVERSVLYRMLRFSQMFPNVATWQHLTWSHYRILLGIENRAERQRLLRETEKSRWSARRLEEAVRHHKAQKRKSGRVAVLPEPERGTPGAVQVGWLASLDGTKRKVLDLGFWNYSELSPAERKKFSAGDLLRPGKSGWVKAGQEAERWFYEADVERVVDGDTLLVHVHLPLGLKRRQYLRFLHVNAEPATTGQGAKAKRWLAGRLQKSARIQFRSHKTDRYDRYLADIWAGDTYLNQALLAAGLAKPYKQR